MNFRLLKRRELWLLGHEKEKLFSTFPKESQIVIAENEDGSVIGHWALIPYWHLECFEIREDHRKKAGVAKGLIRFAFGVLRSKGVKAALTAAITEEVEKYLLRLKAIQLPGKHFVLPIGQGEK